MQILLTNDDGIFSPGLAAMAGALQSFGDVCIAAPATEQSGVGQSITFLNPLAVKQLLRDDRFWGYAVTGSPVDCVKLGVCKLAPVRPDLIVSGINNGLNTGANIIYSGTVAAALEGAYQRITSIAVSVQFIRDGRNDLFSAAAELAANLIRDILKKPESKGELFNINIPKAAITGSTPPKILVTDMDTDLYWNEYDERTDPTGRTYYWLAGRPSFKDIDGQRDMGRVSHGAVTITPLDYNPTKWSMMKTMADWDFSNVPMPAPVPLEIPQKTTNSESIQAKKEAPGSIPPSTNSAASSDENNVFLNFRMVQK